MFFWQYVLADAKNQMPDDEFECACVVGTSPAAKSRSQKRTSLLSNAQAAGGAGKAPANGEGEKSALKLTDGATHFLFPVMASRNSRR